MSQKKTIVSIMVPVYNGISTIGLAVRSLLHQTYDNWECIIVNDGSDDGTRNFLDALVDPRFVVIHFEKNKGRPYARQVALESAKGKYLAFLDADDFYHPEKLAMQVELLEHHPEVDLVSCANASYDGDFKILTVRGGGTGKMQLYRFGDRMNCALRTSLIRTHFAKKIQFNQKLKQAQDTDFLQRYLNGKRYIAMPEVLYYYSEFVSVTGRKILRTYYYSLIHHSSLLRFAFFANARAIVMTIGKAIVTVVFLPFVDVSFFLKRRGRLPAIQEADDFSKVGIQLGRPYETH